MPAQMDIVLQRNEDYARLWEFRNDDLGDPIDLTDKTLAMQVRVPLDNSGSALARADFTVTDAANGQAEVLLLGSSGPLSTYGDPIQSVDLRYDATISDGTISVALVSGTLRLERGVTHS